MRIIFCIVLTSIPRTPCVTHLFNCSRAVMGRKKNPPKKKAPERRNPVRLARVTERRIVDTEGVVVPNKCHNNQLVLLLYANILHGGGVQKMSNGGGGNMFFFFMLRVRRLANSRNE